MYCEDCMLHGNLEVKAWPNLKIWYGKVTGACVGMVMYSVSLKPKCVKKFRLTVEWVQSLPNSWSKSVPHFL